VPDLEGAEAANLDVLLFLERFLDASRKESTTRAQSFLEIIGPAVRDIWAVTRSTRSAFVMGGPRSGAAEGVES